MPDFSESVKLLNNEVDLPRLPSNSTFIEDCFMSNFGNMQMPDTNFEPPSNRLEFADLVLTFGKDGRKGTVTRKGIPIDLMPFEFGLLAALMLNLNLELTAGELYDKAWLMPVADDPDRLFIEKRHGRANDPSEVIRGRVAKLRNKLGEPNLIPSGYGRGYRLCIDAPKREYLMGRYFGFRGQKQAALS